MQRPVAARCALAAIFLIRSRVAASPARLSSPRKCSVSAADAVSLASIVLFLVLFARPLDVSILALELLMLSSVSAVSPAGAA